MFSREFLVVWERGSRPTAPQEPQFLDEPSEAAPHLGQEAPCILLLVGGLVEKCSCLLVYEFSEDLCRFDVLEGGRWSVSREKGRGRKEKNVGKKGPVGE